MSMHWQHYNYQVIHMMFELYNEYTYRAIATAMFKQQQPTTCTHCQAFIQLIVCQHVIAFKQCDATNNVTQVALIDDEH